MSSKSTFSNSTSKSYALALYELAKENSRGHRAQMGGLWEKVTIGSLAKPYDILETYALKMQPGQVSVPIESYGHIFIIKLEEKTEAGCEPFEKVQQRIEAEIRFRRRKARFDEMVSKIIDQAHIEDMDRFVDFCVETAYRRCDAQ